MALLEIIKYGDPVLRQEAAPVEQFDDELFELVDDMIETMQAANGIGLAAPQVNVSKALCVVDVGLIEEGREPQAFVNPEILEEFGDKAVREEGCLSIPDISEDVERIEGVRVRYQDLSGETHEIQVNELFARVLQHEIDHLNGVFFTDRLSALKRKLLSKKLRKIAAEAKEERLLRRAK